jgi:hypothetical protein
MLSGSQASLSFPRRVSARRGHGCWGWISLTSGPPFRLGAGELAGPNYLSRDVLEATAIQRQDFGGQASKSKLATVAIILTDLIETTVPCRKGLGSYGSTHNVLARHFHA